MNLFCVGLSHHTANVETRERFAGGADAESTLREAGCAEALVLATCNRVEVYGASEKRVSTDEIAQCLLQNADVSDRGHGETIDRSRSDDSIRNTGTAISPLLLAAFGRVLRAFTSRPCQSDLNVPAMGGA